MIQHAMDSSLALFQTPMTLDREYEKFKGGPTPQGRDRLHVTINSRGQILLNKAVHRELGSPAAINLYFNRPKDIIAIEPTHPRLPLVFPLRENGGSYRVFANPFCKHHGIKIPGTQAFVRPDIDKGVLLLDLGALVNVGGWTRKRKRKA